MVVFSGTITLDTVKLAFEPANSAPTVSCPNVIVRFFKIHQTF
jgi:hypothetical protein